MKIILLMIFVLLLLLQSISHSSNQQPYTYAVVVSRAAYADNGWRGVADSLLKKHSETESRLFIWEKSINEVRDDLAVFMPTYIGFVAQPVTECNSAFIAEASQLSRKLDKDPYGDAYWGIITGYQSSDASRAISESLLVKTTILASNGINHEPPLQRYYQGIGLPCDSYTKTDYLFPNTSGKIYSIEQRPEKQVDRVHLITKWLNAEKLSISVSGKGTIAGTFDCLITGGHGNINLWQMHYNDAGSEGFLRSSNGQLSGLPYSGGSIAINSPTPKVYWHASNCLMGSPDNINNWVYAAFHTGHAVQLFGFIPEASTGDEFMAWGLFDRTTKFAGKYTLPQSHFISNNNALFELRHSTGLFNLKGVQSYMDSTLVYGDPAADVSFYSFGDSARVYKESFSYTTNTDGFATFEYAVTAVAHDMEFGKGYCYQLRPVFFMPIRIDASTVAIVRNDGSIAEITDNLILWEMLKSGKTLLKGATKKLIWTAKLLAQTDKTITRATGNEPNTITLGCAIEKKGLHITYNNIPAGEVSLFISDISGKKIWKGHSISNGMHQNSLNSPIMTTPGIYFVTLRHGDRSITITFIK